MRGTARIDAPLSAVAAVIDDVPAITTLNDVVAKAEVTQRQSATRYRVYAATKMPWPVSNRHIVNQHKVRQHQVTTVVTILETASTRDDTRESPVRPANSPHHNRHP